MADIQYFFSVNKFEEYQKKHNSSKKNITNAKKVWANAADNKRVTFPPGSLIGSIEDEPNFVAFKDWCTCYEPKRIYITCLADAKKHLCAKDILKVIEYVRQGKNLRLKDEEAHAVYIIEAGAPLYTPEGIKL